MAGGQIYQTQSEKDNSGVLRTINFTPKAFKTTSKGHLLTDYESRITCHAFYRFLDLQKLLFRVCGNCLEYLLPLSKFEEELEDYYL